MRISTKGRYGLAVMIKLGENSNTVVPISNLSQALGLSKIYLEQVLTLLKAGNLVTSVKGPQGGYSLMHNKLTIKEILVVLEPSLFEIVEDVSTDDLINSTLCVQVFNPMQNQLNKLLDTLTLEELVSQVVDQRLDAPMFYI